MEEVVCPLCNSQNSRLLFSLSATDAAGILLRNRPDQRDKITKIIEGTWSGNHAFFLHCTNCSFGFASPFHGGSPELYSEIYYSAFKYPEMKWEYLKTVESLKTRLGGRQGYSLLEIGAGNGVFLDYITAKNLVDKANIFATEFSEPAVLAIKSKGYSCDSKDIVQLSGNETLPRFDVICMFQVLEHLDEIDPVFRALNRISSSNADLFISVPNSKLRNLLDMHGVHYDIPPVHIGRYSVKSFDFLCQKYSWYLVSYAYEPMSYPGRMKKFLFERYWSGIFPNTFESKSNTHCKKIYRYALMLRIIIRYFFVFIALGRKDMGTSLWVHLKKNA